MPDKLGAQRSEADYRVDFSVAGRDRSGVGRALDQSETGMSFVTDAPLEPGSCVTVRVPLQSKSAGVLVCLANVVSCLARPDSNGYSVGCACD